MVTNEVVLLKRWLLSLILKLLQECQLICHLQIDLLKCTITASLSHHLLIIFNHRAILLLESTAAFPSHHCLMTSNHRVALLLDSIAASLSSHLLVMSDQKVILLLAELGKLLYESNILHISSYSRKKSNLKVTYFFI